MIFVGAKNLEDGLKKIGFSARDIEYIESKLNPQNHSKEVRALADKFISMEPSDNKNVILNFSTGIGQINILAFKGDPDSDVNCQTYLFVIKDGNDRQELFLISDNDGFFPYRIYNILENRATWNIDLQKNDDYRAYGFTIETQWSDTVIRMEVICPVIDASNLTSFGGREDG